MRTWRWVSVLAMLVLVLAACGQYALAIGRNEIRGGLLYGLVLGPLTAIVTTLIFRLLLRSPYWKPT